MEILAHRGLWENASQKNQLQPLINALDKGFGIETDIRDFNGELVISHDPPCNYKKILKLEDFFESYNKIKSINKLALNIKSDGIAKQLSFLLTKYSITNYFVFDTSIPDFLNFHKQELKIFCRFSEFENPNLLKKLSSGLWLDSFSQDFYEEINLESVTENWNNVCFVSPELHNFSKEKFWEKLKIFIKNTNIRNLSICTDNPFEAKNYFNI